MHYVTVDFAALYHIEWCLFCVNSPVQYSSWFKGKWTSFILMCLFILTLNEQIDDIEMMEHIYF